MEESLMGNLCFLREMNTVRVVGSLLDIHL